MNLNQQQKQFITEYIRTLDAEASLKKAGYKDRNLKSLATKFLNDKNIVDEIRLQMKKQIDKRRREDSVNTNMKGENSGHKPVGKKKKKK